MNRESFRRAGLSLLMIIISVVVYGCESKGKPEVSRTPDIGISWCEDTSDSLYSEDLQAYINAVIKSGGHPVLLPLIESEDQAREVLKAVDGLVMTGGEDVDPSYYGEDPDVRLETPNSMRDQSDALLLKAALEADTPLLAICRGAQFLNVVCGGTLYQDIPTQVPTEIRHRDPAMEAYEYHEVTVAKDSRLSEIYGTEPLMVNSWHHQCVKRLGDGLTAAATSEDGIVEAFEMKGSTFRMGVQFHPEWEAENGSVRLLEVFRSLVESASAGD